MTLILLSMIKLYPFRQKSLFEIGQKIFSNQCAQCHQSNGQGVTGVYPPLVASNWVLGHQEVLARILINGMNGKVEVFGKTYNGNMPAFGPSGLNLKPKQIAGVLTYIRQEWGNDSSEMTEATLKDYMESVCGSQYSLDSGGTSSKSIT